MIRKGWSGGLGGVGISLILEDDISVGGLLTYCRRCGTIASNHSAGFGEDGWGGGEDRNGSWDGSGQRKEKRRQNIEAEDGN